MPRDLTGMIPENFTLVCDIVGADSHDVILLNHQACDSVVLLNRAASHVEKCKAIQRSTGMNRAESIGDV